MAIDYSGFAFPKGTPQTLVRHAKGVQLAGDLAKAYADVDARDQKRCQVRGTLLSAGAVDEWKRLERHHLAEKSTAKSSRADADNILTVSAAVHALMGSSALIPVDAKGKETKRVSQITGYRWNVRVVKPGKEPFRLTKWTWR